MKTNRMGAVGDIPGVSPAAYDGWRASAIGAVTEQLERRLILELVGDVRGQTVLDVGCGDGDIAVEFARRGACVVGVDALADMIESARQRAQKHHVDIDFWIATAEDLPLPSERFDVVIAVTILCFITDALPRLIAPHGDRLSAVTTFGAAFVALCARKRSAVEPGRPGSQ